VRFEDTDDSAYVTLRYCGLTKSRPWDRHVLIALFRDGVLNLQGGGKDVMTFTNEDQTAFPRLGPDTVELLEQHTQQCSQVMQDSIVQYIKDVRTYIDVNPTTRGTKKHIFMDKVHGMLLR
jgi:hypothetical protein